MRTSPRLTARIGISLVTVVFAAALSLIGAQAAQAFNNPSAPSGLSATAGGNGTVAVSWNNPMTDFDHTVITVSPGGQTYSGTGSSNLFSGLISGQTYTFSAVAYNADPAYFSTAATTTATATGLTVPGAPSNVVGTVADGTLSLSWSAPTANGGSGISSYTVTLNSGQTCTVSTTSCVFTGLTNGTAYTATVTATNTTGTSAASAASAAITPAAETLATTGTAFVLPLGIASASAILGIWLLLRRRLAVF